MPRRAKAQHQQDEEAGEGHDKGKGEGGHEAVQKALDSLLSLFGDCSSSNTAKADSKPVLSRWGELLLAYRRSAAQQHPDPFALWVRRTLKPHILRRCLEVRWDKNINALPPASRTRLSALASRLDEEARKVPLSGLPADSTLLAASVDHPEVTIHTLFLFFGRKSLNANYTLRHICRIDGDIEAWYRDLCAACSERLVANGKSGPFRFVPFRKTLDPEFANQDFSTVYAARKAPDHPEDMTPGPKQSPRRSGNEEEDHDREEEQNIISELSEAVSAAPDESEDYMQLDGETNNKPEGNSEMGSEVERARSCPAKLCEEVDQPAPSAENTVSPLYDPAREVEAHVGAHSATRHLLQGHKTTQGEDPEFPFYFDSGSGAWTEMNPDQVEAHDRCISASPVFPRGPELEPDQDCSLDPTPSSAPQPSMSFAGKKRPREELCDDGVSTPEPALKKSSKAVNDVIDDDDLASFGSAGPSNALLSNVRIDRLRPTYVTDNDVKTLRDPNGLVNDAIVDTALEMITAMGHAFRNVSCQGLKAALDSNGHIRTNMSQLFKDDVSTKILIGQNFDNFHWVLLEINMVEHTIKFWDSMSSHRADVKNLAEKYYLEFLASGRCKDTGETPMTMAEGGWRLLEELCPQQPNSYDCGVYTIVNALHIVADLKLPKTYDGAL